MTSTTPPDLLPGPPGNPGDLVVQGELFRVSPSAVPLWRISEPLGDLVVLVLLGAGTWWVAGRDWHPAFTVVLLALTALAAVFLVLDATVLPVLRQRRWRYRIGPELVETDHAGLLSTTRAVVPVSSIQHVTLKQGPLLRRFGLTTVQISTFGETHEIPALEQDRAETVRAVLAEHVRSLREQTAGNRA